MPTTYDPQKDPNALVARGIGEPAGEMVRITPSDAANLAVYCKAFRVYVPTSVPEATLRVTPAIAKDDADTVTLKYAPGVTFEPLSIRKVFVTGTSVGIEIHGFMV